MFFDAFYSENGIFSRWTFLIWKIFILSYEPLTWAGSAAMTSRKTSRSAQRLFRDFKETYLGRRWQLLFPTSLIATRRDRPSLRSGGSKSSSVEILQILWNREAFALIKEQLLTVPIPNCFQPQWILFISKYNFPIQKNHHINLKTFKIFNLIIKLNLIFIFQNFSNFFNIYSRGALRRFSTVIGNQSINSIGSIWINPIN